MSFLWRDVSPHVSVFAGPPLSRRYVLAAGLTAAGVLASYRFAIAPAYAADAAGGDGARQFIGDLANKAITMMVDKSLSDKDRTQKFRELFVASFDLPTIGEHVLGRYWRSATPDQRSQFLKLFEEQEVLTWASRIKGYNGEKLTVVSAEADQNGASHVNTRIERPNGAPISLEWVVAQTNGAWRISDIVVEGASMSITLRQDFASVLQSNGGKVDGLLTAMRKKIEQLGGTA